MITPTWKPLLRKILQQIDIHIDIRIYNKIFQWTWTIHINTAHKIINQIYEKIGVKYSIADLFIRDNLKWRERDRVVIYEESENLFTKDDWISLVRYVIEKRWD